MHLAHILGRYCLCLVKCSPVLLAMQDSGGYTASGEVPEAAPINVNGERQLRSEVDGLIRQLNVDEEWTRRIEALLRLEGLVKGGAAAIPGFLDQLKTLQDPIIVQLQDRCAHMCRHIRISRCTPQVWQTFLYLQYNCAHVSLLCCHPCSQ